MSAFHSMIDRLLKILLNEIDYNSELNIILTIALNNGYPPNSIHNLISKKKFKLLLKQSYTPSISNQETTYKKLTYINNYSEKLSFELRKFNTQCGFYNKNNLKSKL